MYDRLFYIRISPGQARPGRRAQSAAHKRSHRFRVFDPVRADLPSPGAKDKPTFSRQLQRETRLTVAAEPLSSRPGRAYNPAQ